MRHRFIKYTTHWNGGRGDGGGARGGGGGWGGEEGKLYRIAKARNKATKDFTQTRQINGGHGVVIWEQEKIKGRWKSYFEMLLDEENPRTVFVDGAQNEGITPVIERREVKVALKVAMGPDGIPVEVWKCMGEEGVECGVTCYRRSMNRRQYRRCGAIVPLYRYPGVWQLQGH